MQNHTELDYRSISIPVDTVSLSENANKFFLWLGSFWSDVYEDTDFLKSLQGARALKVAQLYLDVLESLHLQDRNGAPVFHRERWYPVVVKRSRKNKGNVSIVKMKSNNETVIGEQTDPIYPEGSIFNIGGNTEFQEIVTYPSETKIDSILTCIVDNIANPKVILSKGIDFVVDEDSIAMNKKYDPFNPDSPFAVFPLYGDTPENDDAESVLWACDAIIDKNFVYDHLGYSINLQAKSSENYKNIVNRAWDALNEGAKPAVLRRLLAALCDIPTVLEDKETVKKLLFNQENTQVVTDKNVYTLSSYCVLRPSIEVGSVLEKGDFLDTAVKIYPYVRDISTDAGKTEYLDLIETDVPIVDLPPAFFRTGLDDGFSVGWPEKEIACFGFDKNGNPKLSFHLDGSEEDNTAYWNDTWNIFEENGISIESCFEGHIYDRVYEIGKPCGSISPIEFFLKHLIGANTLIITVDTSTIADDSPLYDPKFFQTLRDCIPSYIRLFVIEHESVGPEQITLDTESEDADVDDSAELYVYDKVEDECGFGNVIPMRASSRDRIVSKKWINSCKDYYDEIN